MPKLPRISGLKMVQVLERLGFFHARQKGSHVVMKKITDGDSFGCVVPLHKELATGTLRSILRQARLSTEDFLKHF